MKPARILWAIAALALSMTFFMQIIASEEQQAGQIIAELAFEKIDLSGTYPGAEAADAYTLTTGQTRQIIIGPDNDTRRLAFVNNSEYGRYYYRSAGKFLPLSETAFEVVINNRAFAVDHMDSADALAGAGWDNNRITALKQALGRKSAGEGFFVISPSDADATTIGDAEASALFLPDDGHGAVVMAVGGVLQAKEFPLTLVITKPVAAATHEQAAQAVLSSSGEKVSAPGEEVSCFDADAGRDSYTTASYIIHTYSDLESHFNKQAIRTDWCAVEGTDSGITKSTLFEWKCVSGQPMFEEVSCADAFGEGYACISGACVDKNNMSAVSRWCMDTEQSLQPLDSANANDITKILTNKGIAYGFYATGMQQEGLEGINYLAFTPKADVCATPFMLSEHYCEGDSIAYKNFVCPSGCADGVCASGPYCIETDGGKTTDFSGRIVAVRKVTSGMRKEEKYDNCKDENTVNEYFCNATDRTYGYGEEAIPCGKGKKCIEGKCVAEAAVTGAPCGDGPPCNALQICKDGKCVTKGDEIGFVPCSDSLPCPKGATCSSEGKCVAEAAVTVPICSDTDGGIPTDVFGKITVVPLEGEVVERSDYCINSNTVNEYFCDATDTTDGYGEAAFTCMTGKKCVDGACLEAAKECTSNADCSTDEVCTYADPRSGKKECTSKCTSDEQCADGKICVQGACIKCALNSQCGAGKICSDGACIAETVVTVTCHICDVNNPFNIWEWNAADCSTQPVADTAKLYRCMPGMYCSGGNCIEEPLSTADDVDAAIKRRQAWAVVLNNMIESIYSMKGWSLPEFTAAPSEEEAVADEEITPAEENNPPGILTGTPSVGLVHLPDSRIKEIRMELSEQLQTFAYDNCIFSGGPFCGVPIPDPEPCDDCYLYGIYSPGGFDPNELMQMGITLEMLYDKGYTADQLLGMGFQLDTVEILYGGNAYTTSQPLLGIGLTQSDILKLQLDPTLQLGSMYGNMDQVMNTYQELGLATVV